MTQATVPGWERHVRVEDVDFPLRRFALGAMDDEELLACSKALGIGLSLQEMQDARTYFARHGRDPTDVELEALGQAWSEHCCYKTSKPVLKRHVYGIHEHRIASREDAGIVEFDDEHYYAVGLESHNHPSAVEPYGGAATGVGGILRDVVCMGAQPVALVDPLFFGPLDLPHEELPPGTKHPRFLLQGVVAGIRDYGNRVGIPTVAGGITFHPGYTGNCLVNVGCIGIVRKDRLMHSRAGAPGDVFVYLGNATGRDGIHGVSFASEELNAESEEGSRSAVQVGDAILKEPLIHVTLELIGRGLVTGCKDFGGGGLSCVAGELAFDAGFGCEIDLDQVPTKVPGMAPWEVWVSESQERMMVTARPDQVDEILHVARLWDVPAVVVGRVIEEPVNRVRHHGTPVLELELPFSTGGPVYDRAIGTAPTARRQEAPFDAPSDLGAVLLALLAHPNVMSKEWAVRQYDHEVRAATVLKPLQGVLGSEGPGDAAVIRPVASSDKALALCSDVNPYQCALDPYRGAMGAVDEVVRNLACVGARLSSLCDNLNFGNPEKPERMAELEEAARGLGDMARPLGVPFSSGNVSLYNEGPTRAIPPTPTIMGVGILEDHRHATTMDLKEAGDELVLLGTTRHELGGSLYLQHLGLEGGEVPASDAIALAAAAELVVSAIEAGRVRAAHDPSEGGLAVALAEMAFAGAMGCEVDLAGDLRDDVALFSESHGRFLLEVPPEHLAGMRVQAEAAGIPLVRLGRVTDTGRVVVQGVMDVAAADLRRAWNEALPRLMGEAP